MTGLQEKEDFPLTISGRPITPDDIDTSIQLYGAFDNVETEESAQVIIDLCKDLGGWKPFTEQQIQDFYKLQGHTKPFTFNALIESKRERLGGGSFNELDGGWIIKNGNTYEVTSEFIQHAYETSPKTE